MITDEHATVPPRRNALGAVQPITVAEVLGLYFQEEEAIKAAKEAKRAAKRNPDGKAKGAGAAAAAAAAKAPGALPKWKQQHLEFQNAYGPLPGIETKGCPRGVKIQYYLTRTSNLFFFIFCKLFLSFIDCNSNQNR